MANVQPDEFTKVSNEFLEGAMKYKFSAHETQVLLCIIRLTWGYRKKRVPISLSTFHSYTKMTRQHAHRAIKRLLQKNRIIVFRKEGMTSEYSVQKDYDKWDTVLSTDNTSTGNTPTVTSTGNRLYSPELKTVPSTGNTLKESKENSKESARPDLIIKL